MIPLNEDYNGYFERNDFEWSSAERIGKDEIGRTWWFVEDRQNMDYFYAIYPVDDDLYAIFDFYSAEDGDDYKDWIDLYDEAVADCMASETWAGLD